MTVLVTGASGHVGAALVRALLVRGERVRAVVRSDVRAVKGLDLELARVDVTDERGVDEAVRGASVVYHAAARLTLEATHDPLADQVNVDGTRNIVAACRRHGVRRLVHFSTAHALGRGGGGLLDEGSGLPYERSKAAAEREVVSASETDLDAVIVSPCAVIGPFDHKPSYMGRVLIMLARGLVPAVVVGGQSWVDVRDIAAGAIAAAERGKRGERYVLSGRWLPMLDFMRIAARAAGVSPPLFELPTSVARGFAPLAERAARLMKKEPLFTRASFDALEPSPRDYGDAATRDLGYAPRDLEQTLAETFAWYGERGMMPRGGRLARMLGVTQRT
ncbi:MAG: NAD-dependent epimerase/dehydratase family protein [Polyangiaceae bacterium]|nr:NAD-dependent epimerase/dehydratase family protein [Polyangiaceae bacterium]